jgi:peptide/nickel transport system permease protein
MKHAVWPALAAAARAALLLWLASLVVFVLLRAVPGDPVLIGLFERGMGATPENIAALREFWGFDQPWWAQYAGWMGHLLVGDWGQSLRTGRPVAGELLARLPWSVAIGAGGLGLAAVLSLPLGFLSALRPGGAVDRATRLLTIGAQTVPSFLVAIVLASLISAQLGLLRVYTGTPAERLVLPIVLVAVYSIPRLARVVRSGYLLGAEAPHLTTAMAKGLSTAQALARHAGRPALLALIAALLPQAAWVIGGTAVVEIVFAVPGVSQLVVESVNARDYAVLQVFVMLVATGMVVVHAAAEIARRQLDPRPSCATA